MGGEHTGKRKYLLFYFACFIVVIGTVAGCGTTGVISQKGERSAARENPGMGGEDLYRQGLMLAHPKNPHMDYEKSILYFQSVIRGFPETPLRQASETWILTLETMIEKDHQIETMTRELALQEENILKCRKMNNRLKGQVKRLKSQIKTSQHQIKELKKQIETLKMIDLRIENKKRKTTP